MLTTHTTPPIPAVPAVREPSVIARAPYLIARGAWRRRWIEAPFVGAGLVWVGQGSPVMTGASLAAAGGCAWLSTSKFGTRRPIAHLSAAERETLAVWCGAGAGWTAFAAAAPLPLVIEGPVLAAALAWPTWRWIRSRKIRRYRSDRAVRALADGWTRTVTTHGSVLHIGSKVVAGSLTSPGDGAALFKVRLRFGVHAKAACSEQARQDAEVCLGLPMDTLTLTPERDDSRYIWVAISPGRHMETIAGVPWPKPVLLPDGRIPLAEDEQGRTAYLQLYDKDGVKHWWISGATGGGKSTTLGEALTAAVLAPGGTTILYCDGKGGTSLPAVLAPLMTKVAVTTGEWEALIDIAHTVMLARQARRRGMERWAVGEEPDPIVMLALDDASRIARNVSLAHANRVLEIEEQGRVLGVQVTQVTQGASGALLVGGALARTNLTEAVCHRPQDPTHGRIAVGSSSEEIDLMSLPSQPGWAAVISRGETRRRVRVRYATKDQLAQHTRGYVPLELVGGDLEAAGGVTAEPEPEETPEERQTSAAILHRIITAHRVMALGDLVEKDTGVRKHTTCDICPGWTKSRKTASNTFLRLAADGAVVKEGESWVAV